MKKNEELALVKKDSENSMTVSKKEFAEKEAKLQKEIDDANKKIEQSEKTIAQLNKNIQDKQEELVKAEKNAKLLQNTEAKDALESLKKELQTEKEKMTEQIKIVNEQIESTKTEYERFKEENKLKQEKMLLDIEEYKKQIKLLQNRSSQLRSELEAKNGTNVNEEILKLQQQKAELEKTLTNFKKESELKEQNLKQQLAEAEAKTKAAEKKLLEIQRATKEEPAAAKQNQNIEKKKTEDTTSKAEEKSKTVRKSDDKTSIDNSINDNRINQFKAQSTGINTLPESFNTEMYDWLINSGMIAQKQNPFAIKDMPAPYTKPIDKFQFFFKKKAAQKGIKQNTNKIYDKRLSLGCGSRETARHCHIAIPDSMKVTNHSINSAKYSDLSNYSEKEWETKALNNGKLFTREEFMKNKPQYVLESVDLLNFEGI